MTLCLSDYSDVIHAVIQSANHLISVHVHINHHNRVCEFDCWMVGGFCILETVDPIESFLEFRQNGMKTKSIQQFCERTRLIDDKDKRRMARLLWVDGKVTVTQISTLYNHAEQKST